MLVIKMICRELLAKPGSHAKDSFTEAQGSGTPHSCMQSINYFDDHHHCCGQVLQVNFE